MQIYLTLIIILASIFVLNGMAYMYDLWYRKNQAVKKVKKSWGVLPKQSFKSEDMDSISSYYRNVRSIESKDSLIDDITWNDLDMESVFKRINNTHSSVGEEFLYALLRCPVLSKSGLEERGKLIAYFQTNPKEREKLQIILEQLGKQRHANVSDYMTDFSYLKGNNEGLYRLLAILPILFIGVSVFALQLGMVLFALSFVTNLTIYYKTRRKLAFQIPTVGYAAKFIDTVGDILKAGDNGIEAYYPSLKKCYAPLKKIGKLAYAFASFEGDFLSDYIKITFLVQLRNYNTILKLLKDHQKEFRELYETIGFIDSMISIASYRKTLSYYTEPQFSEYNREGLHVEAIDIYHPLLNAPVPNTIALKQSILITGSNASGKSTFLKTVAMNAIFSQTIYTSLAKSYTSDLFHIMTSMALKDNLYNHESYFVAEIKSLKRILDRLNDKVPCFCFIDEILRGTNTIERIAASSRVLDFLSQSNCICAAATHDVELTNILGSAYENYHFQENIIGDEIIFDYKLYEGNTKSRNAIKLLELMGFQEAIVKDAQHAAFEFETKGSWQQINMGPSTAHPM